MVSSSLLYMGGTPPDTAVTEEWEGAGAPIGAWSTGGAMNTGRGGLASAGTQTATLASGGENPPVNGAYAITELYNGSSWTEVNDLNQGRRLLAGAGTQTSSVVFGGTDGTVYAHRKMEWKFLDRIR